LLGFTGAAGIISALIPYQAVMTVLLFVGLVVGAQAFNESKKKHTPAILLGFLPLIAQYVETAVNETLASVGTNMATFGIENFSSSFPIKGVLALSQGAFLSGLLIAAIVAYIIDRDFVKAALFSLFSAFCAFIGLIHAPSMEWGAPNGIPFATVYLVLALGCQVLAIREARTTSDSSNVTENLEEVF
jgi:AGZA family xanthine/uracil permease-like MFS transporter